MSICSNPTPTFWGSDLLTKSPPSSNCQWTTITIYLTIYLTKSYWGCFIYGQSAGTSRPPGRCAISLAASPLDEPGLHRHRNACNFQGWPPAVFSQLFLSFMNQSITCLASNHSNKNLYIKVMLKEIKMMSRILSRSISFDSEKKSFLLHIFISQKVMHWVLKSI